MNYIYNVQYNDKFRLRLIEQDVEKKKKHGNTEHILSYTIKKPKGGNIDYDLTIIDTPGFGDDIVGIEKDIQILKEFKYVFNSVLANIDCICFVVKSHDNRLTASQEYVFNNILNLWGKDVLENIFITMIDICLW